VKEFSIPFCNPIREVNLPLWQGSRMSDAEVEAVIRSWRDQVAF
jgi:hypothetical protein